MKRGGFLHEMSRRRVWQVAGAYIVLGWVAVEIALETFPLLGLPEWMPRAAVILGYAGFPIAIVLAWIFDITREGVVVTPRLEEAPASEEGPGRVLVHPRPALVAGVFGAGMLVALVGLGAYSAFNPRTPVRPEAIEAVAVLPFTDLSAERDQQHFADGIAEELINRLGQIGDLRVAARTSSFEIRAAGATLEDVGRRLNVDAVVEGTVRRDGDRLRVTVDLVDVATGFQIWSGRYDRTVEDLFAIQDEVSGAIVEALSLHLGPTSPRLADGTPSVRAHDAYLLGLARWHAGTEADLLRARDYFSAAVAEDDDFALAHAGLALTYAVLPAHGSFPANRATEEGLAAAARALQADAHLAEAHAAIGQIAQALEWDLVAAEIAYRRAIEARPSYATARQWYAEALMAMGRLGEARREVDRALALDPLSLGARYAKAHLLVVERDYAGARAGLGGVLEQNPGHGLGGKALLFLCLAADCPADAARAARAVYPEAVADVVVGVVHARDEPSARPAALERLRGVGEGLPRVERALLHAALDDRDGALALIGEAYAARGDPLLPLFLIHPLFDGLRGDPRYREVAEAIGVETPAARLAASLRLLRPSAG